MDIKVEKKDGNLCVIDITVDVKRANQEYEKACKRIAQRVNIEGFRRGKAPKAILEQRIGIESIKSDAVGVIAQEACSKAIKDNNLDVITEPLLRTVEYNFDKPSHFVVEIELRPELILPQYKGLTVEVEAYKTPADAMEKQLNSIR